MTAEVAIINKNAVALAADSAVTLPEFKAGEIEMKSAVLYARVSSKDEEREGYSLFSLARHFLPCLISTTSVDIL
jgi:hypothetical protein